MNISQKQIDLIQSLFTKKFFEINAPEKFCRATYEENKAKWNLFLVTNKIKKEKPELASEASTKPSLIFSGITISNPEDYSEYLIIPKEFAEKTLVLGFLP